MEKVGEGKIGKSIQERAKQEMTNKTKARTIIEDKWERKKYLQECDSETIKDIIKKKPAYVANELQLYKG